MITDLCLTFLTCLPLLGAGAETGAQQPAQRSGAQPSEGSAGGQERGPERSASARERWERMSEEERAVLRARFEELRRLSPEEREALEERHRGVESMRERVRGRLSPEVRRELEELDPKRRQDLLHEELVEEARGRGARIREKLPREFERELEAAPPEERPLLLEGFRREQFERRAERHLDRVARHLGLPDAERERIAALPPHEHRRELARLEQQLMLRRAEESGRPPMGIDGAEWERLRQLPPEAFLDELMRRKVEGRPGGERARRGPGRGGDTGTESTLEGPARKRLQELLRPEVSERLEFARLSREERARAVAERVSGRALDYLEREGLLAPTELEHLRGLPGPERLWALRELGHGRREQPGGRPGGPRGEPGGRPGGPPEPPAGRPGPHPEARRGTRPGARPETPPGPGPERAEKQRRDASRRRPGEPR